ASRGCVTERAQEATTQCGRMGAEAPATRPERQPFSVVDELKQFAYDLLWTWQPRIEALFRALDPELWKSTRENPVLLLSQLGEAGVKKACERQEVQKALEAARQAYHEYYNRHPRFMDAQAPLAIAYFSLEFGITECLPIYSGGLGVLAGDHLKATSDLGLPLVAVGLLYRQGFGRQDIDANGRQIEVYYENRGAELPVRKVEGVEVEAPIGGRNVRIAVWRAQVGRVPLFLLDTDVETNAQDLRHITDRLYVPEPDRRLRQELVLGIGGVRALRALGLDSGVFHLTEGHSFLCAIERIRELRASRQMTLEEARLVARAGIVFTTHTPIAAGSDYFDPGLAWDLLGPYLSQTGLSFERFMDLGRQRPGDPRGQLVSTYLALRLADFSVGVSRLHEYAGRLRGSQLDPDALTIAFSRRFAPYKRATLLLRDRRRLAKLLGDAQRPVQLIFSGKAHPADTPGKALLHDIVELARSE